MCGIYGFIGDNDNKTIPAIRYLGLRNQERGTDSTGIAIITGNSYLFSARAVPSMAFYNSKPIKNMLAIANKSGFLNIIGHTRHATTGAVNHRNAQPFRASTTVFAHNGIISNYKQIFKKHGFSHEVDSYALGVELNHRGIKGVGDNISGWYAMAYMFLDNKFNQQWLVDYNNLAFAIVNNGVYYSSDLLHLRASMLKYQYKAKYIQAKDGIHYKADYKGAVTFTKARFRKKPVFTYRQDGYFNTKGIYTPYPQNTKQLKKAWNDNYSSHALNCPCNECVYLRYMNGGIYD